MLVIYDDSRWVHITGSIAASVRIWHAREEKSGPEGRPLLGPGLRDEIGVG